MPGMLATGVVAAALALSLPAGDAPASDAMAAGGTRAGNVDAAPAAGRYRISVITMGQGVELFARFGHIAFLVEDFAAGTERVYNFGMFDFANPALRFKYLKGYLIYWVGVQGFPSTVRTYSRLDRAVEQRVLEISPAAAERLAHRLAENARPENRDYEYRHYLDNCCTRIRDLADEASGGAIAAGRKGPVTGRTYRYWTRQSLKGPLASAVVIDFILGPAIDKPLDRWAEEFLPSVLAEDLDKAALPDGRPLVSARKVLYARTGPQIDSVREPWDLPIAASFAALLLLGLGVPLALGRARKEGSPGPGARLAGVGLLTWALLGGLGGAALTFLWTATTHYDTHHNENLLVFLPTHLLLIGPAVMLLARGRLGETTGRLLVRYLAASAGIVVLALLLKLRPAPQQNYGFMAFGLAMDLLCLAALVRTGAASLRR